MADDVGGDAGRPNSITELCKYNTYINYIILSLFQLKTLECKTKPLCY